jgi:hypothetical protein
MLLKGSCQCEKVKYEVETNFYYPYMICYCSICRKTNGAPFGVNIKGKLCDLKITKGDSYIKTFNANGSERCFCMTCGSPLYITNNKWPEDVWPNAASIDTPLPEPPEYQQIFIDDQIKWYQPDLPGKKFNTYPDWSIDEFHQHWDLLP